MNSTCVGMWLGQLSMGPGVPLTQVLTPLLMKVFFSQSQTFSVCCTQCCTRMLFFCVHIKNSKHWQPHHCLSTQKYCAHW